MPIFHNRDLVHWRKIGHVLDRPEQLPLRQPEKVLMDGILAPTIRYHAGKFYCVTTNTGHHGSILVSAEDPAGPWSDPILLKHRGLDNSLFFDDDGLVYYHWCQPGTPGGNIVQVLLDPATGTFLSEPKVISPGIGEGGAEGPHIYKINGWYYLLIAEGGTHSGHLLSIQRSRSPWGPFEPSPHGLLLTHRHTEMNQIIKALGHGELIEDHNGKWWVFTLGFRTTGWICFASHILCRETFLAPPPGASRVGRLSTAAATWNWRWMVRCRLPTPGRNNPPATILMAWNLASTGLSAAIRSRAVGPSLTSPAV